MKQTPSEFFKTYSKTAVNDSLFSGIPPSIKLAQAALESSWGGSGLTVNANNYFGIKANDWSGAVYNAETHEYYSGSATPTTINAMFREYGSAYESFMDHSKFLKKHDRYAGLFALDPLDYKGWAYGLQAAHYATSPTYAEKLIGIIEKYDLQKYDLRAERLRTVKNFALALLLISAVVVTVLILKKFVFK